MPDRAGSTLHVIRKRPLGGLSVLIASPYEAAHAVIDAAQSEPPAGAAIHLINAYSIALVQRDEAFREVLSGPALNFPDGKPLSWLTRFSDQPLQQVRGPQFFLDVMDLGRATSVRHFLLGGSEELLERLRDNLSQRYPGVIIAGTHSPPFRAVTDAEIDAQDDLIRRSKPDIVWVGLGTPKQDHEVQRLADRLDVVACAVGAAFDFTAGTKREAPRWMTRVGLEWMFRLLSEPRRLWKRYLIGNVVFLRAVLKDH